MIRPRRKDSGTQRVEVESEAEMAQVAPTKVEDSISMWYITRDRRAEVDLLRAQSGVRVVSVGALD